MKQINQARLCKWGGSGELSQPVLFLKVLVGRQLLGQAFFGVFEASIGQGWLCPPWSVTQAWAGESGRV